MNKKFFGIFLILIVTTLVLPFSGCGSNEIHFYMGTSANVENDTSLQLNNSITVKQNKEKIVNGELVFNKNNDNSFDSLYLSFKGNNIKNLIAKSQNKTILYDNYDTFTRCVDIFDLYYSIDKTKVNETFDANSDFESKWDSGNFDEIKNVYFDGMSYIDIVRSRKDAKKEVANVDAVLLDSDTLNDSDKLYYLDEKKSIVAPVVSVSMLKRASDPDFKKKSPKNPDDCIILGDSVKTNDNMTQDSFIYRYEKLFYNSQQSAIKSKDNFDYADLKGETIEITVNYNNNSKEEYLLDVSFDSEGNIIANLKNNKN